MSLGKTNTRMLTGTEYDSWQDTYTNFSQQSASNASVYSTVNATSGYWPTAELGSAAYTLSSSYFPIDGNLDDINDVIITALSADQALVWNGVAWVNRALSLTAGARGAIYYPSTAASVISPYYELQPFPVIDGPVVQSATTSSVSGEVLIDAHITDELNVESIPVGLWTLNTYAFVDNVGGVSELIVRAYIRSIDTTETQIFYNSSGELATSATLRISNTALSAISTNVTDRLLLKFFAKTSSVPPRTISYIQNTPNSYTTIQTPLEIVHNNLVGLQGGADSQYYHLTLDEYNNASSVYSTVNSNSATSWNYQGTDVKALTSNWQSTYATFGAQSANDVSVFSTVQTNSATNWNYQGADVKALTASWQNTYTSFNAQSANNASTYTTVQANSAAWSAGGGTIDTGVRALTSNWQNAYTTVNSNSATWGAGGASFTVEDANSIIGLSIFL